MRCRQRAVLVTGASTGIGRKITEQLVAEGHFVYAGARKTSDLRALSAIENVLGLSLDVNSPQDIATAVDTVSNSKRGLYGLVNNAGIGSVGPIVGGDSQEIDLVMATNIRGPYWITRAFAPLIMAEKGRIVTIGSISGILAEKNIGAYCMSKHAMEAFTDSLALEMEPEGVRVSIVEPGPFNTEIGTNIIERMGANPSSLDFSKYEEPDIVATAVLLALFERKPKRRYLVVSNQEEAHITIKKKMEELVQLNERHPFSYDRAALTQMLEEAIANVQR